MNSTNFAVQYGRTTGGKEGGETAFPFIYGFKPIDQDTWEQDKDPTTFADFIDNGVVVAAGKKVDIGVTLDPDYNFKLLRIKYTVYALSAGNYFFWHLPLPIGAFFLDQAQPMGIVHHRFERYIKANVSWMPQGEYLYGSTNSFQQTTETAPLIPLVVDSAQGNEYGPGQFNLPVLLPANGLLRFELQNTYTADLLVTAAIYGLKVRL